MTIVQERLDARFLGELGKYRLHAGIVRGDRAALAQVAGRAGQDQVVERVAAARGHWHEVIDVEYPALVIEELKHPSFGDLGSGGPEATVLADAAISFGYCVACALGDVFGAISHAVSLAATQAETPALDVREEAA